MVVVNDWGKLLKELIWKSGHELKDVAAFMGISPQTYSARLKGGDVSIETALSTLDFIKADIVSIIYTTDEARKYRPDYITDEWAEILRLLHTQVDPVLREKIKTLFDQMLEIVLQSP